MRGAQLKRSDASPSDLPPLTEREKPGEAWPAGEQPSPGAGVSAEQAAQLEKALDAGFAEDESRGVVGTRAIAIVYKGRLVAERYAPGFTPQTRLLGYSMSKSVIATLAGLRLGDGRLALDQSGLFDEWKGEGDTRAAIAVRNLLNMTAGLSFTEDYADPFSDVILAVSQSDDAAAYAASRPVIAPPGTVFHYSTGTNFMLSKSVRLSFPDTAAYWRYARSELLDRIGMNDAVIEPDASGTFMFVWATARDWARFGLLYLKGGTWQGKAVLPPSFVDFVRTPTPLSSPEKPYGGQFWLNSGVAAGVRRVEAVTGDNALAYLQSLEGTVNAIAGTLKAAPAEVPARLAQVLEQVKSLEKELAALKGKLASSQGDELVAKAIDVKGLKVLAAQLDGADAKALRETLDKLKDKLKSAAIVLATVEGGKVQIAAGVTADAVGKVKAGELVNFVAQQVGGKGGGKPDMAMAGGTEPAKLGAALASVQGWVAERA